jgi:hypothetical protein
MNPLAHEYKRLRDGGVQPVEALNRMRDWREDAIESLLARAEKAGIPEGIQKLTVQLHCEAGKLVRGLARLADGTLRDVVKR